MAFPDAQHVFRTETKGERADVASALRLSASAAANVGFELVLSCRPGQRVMVIAATQGDLFAPLEPRCARRSACPKSRSLNRIGRAGQCQRKLTDANFRKAN